MTAMPNPSSHQTCAKMGVFYSVVMRRHQDNDHIYPAIHRGGCTGRQTTGAEESQQAQSGSSRWYSRRRPRPSSVPHPGSKPVRWAGSTSCVDNARCILRRTGAYSVFKAPYTSASSVPLVWEMLGDPGGKKCSAFRVHAKLGQMSGLRYADGNRILGATGSQEK